MVTAIHILSNNSLCHLLKRSYRTCGCNVRWQASLWLPHPPAVHTSCSKARPPGLSPTCSLDFQMPTDLELSGWIAPLKELRWLSVTAPRIMVAADVGHLTNLHTLQVRLDMGEAAATAHMATQGMWPVVSGVHPPGSLHRG